MGHRQILIIESEVNRGASLKVKGYQRAFAEAGMELNSGSILYLNADVDSTSSIAYSASDLRSTAINIVKQYVYSFPLLKRVNV